MSEQKKKLAKGPLQRVPTRSLIASIRRDLKAKLKDSNPDKPNRK